MVGGDQAILQTAKEVFLLTCHPPHDQEKKKTKAKELWDISAESCPRNHHRRTE